MKKNKNVKKTKNKKKAPTLFKATMRSGGYRPPTPRSVRKDTSKVKIALGYRV